MALIDSGVQPVKGLDGTNVVHGPDLSFEAQSPYAHLDTYGHGTHLAGIISGRDGTAPANLAAGTPVFGYRVSPVDLDNPTLKFRGVAPFSRTVSVKVADSTGATDVTQVIAGIDWVVRHKNDNGLNIRVINLSYGLNADDDWKVDALSYAVEQAWLKGIVVVASAGNGGKTGAYGAQIKSSQAGGLASPAYNRDILAVGAYDVATGLADFSSTASVANTRAPDVVAPGHSILSLYDPGSTQEAEILQDCANTRAVNQPWTQPVTGDLRFVKGSGTSQAAAMVSGAVALMLSKDPSLTPDQVKFLLRGTAIPIPGAAGKDNNGEGKVNLAGLVKREGKNSMAQKTGLVVAGGSLDAARGHDPVTGHPNVLEASDKMVALLPNGCDPSRGTDDALPFCVPLALTGDTNIAGEKIDMKALQGAESGGTAEAKGSAWCSLGWNGWGFCIDNVNVTGRGLPTPGRTEVWRGGTFRVNTNFDNVKLLGPEQAERQLVLGSPGWTTAADWAGHTWVPHVWEGHKWAGHKWVTEDWDGHKWAGHKWAADSWLSANFDGHKWAGHKWVGHKWAGNAWVDFTWS